MEIEWEEKISQNFPKNICTQVYKTNKPKTILKYVMIILRSWNSPVIGCLHKPILQLVENRNKKGPKSNGSFKKNKSSELVWIILQEINQLKQILNPFYLQGKFKLVSSCRDAFVHEGDGLMQEWC